MNLRPYYIREQVIHATRTFFLDQGFHEVFPPTLNKAVPTEPNIYPFRTIWNTKVGENELYLSTSPERGIKKMLAQGIGNCFAVSKSFRNLEDSGSKHLPEYMMLEWYREDAEYPQIMRDLQKLISFINEKANGGLDLPKDWPVYSLEDLFKQHAGLNLQEILSGDALVHAAKEKGYTVDNASWNELFDQIFVHEIERNMPNTPYYIVDFPARLSPLCKVKKDKPYFAERFEFFMNCMEIANGNNENLDYKSLEKTVKDQEFIDSIHKMSESGKSYAGIGLGIDRLAMIMANIDDISQLA